MQPYLTEWKQILSKGTHGIKNDGNHHTFATYFRLFANKVLPADVVPYALYLDTDVIALANLAKVFQSVQDYNDDHSKQGNDGHAENKEKDQEPIFFMAGHNAGVMMVNIGKLDTFWQLAEQIQWTPQSLNLADNSMVNGVRYAFKGTVVELPQAWDLTLSRDFRKFRVKEELVKFRPEAGLFHYSGGGASKETAFEGDFVTKHPEGFGLPAVFYRNLPWSWVRFMASSAAAGAPKTLGRSRVNIIERTIHTY